MKKGSPKIKNELRPEYDLKNLQPDVAEVFPSAESVNEALRFLIRITKDNRPPLGEPGGDA